MRVLTGALLLLSVAAGGRGSACTVDLRPFPGPAEISSNPLVAEGDRMYSRRQEGRVGPKAGAGPINQAILAYEEAARDPDYVEARWKLVRALYFKGAYTGLDPESRKAVFQKARRVAEEAIGILQKSLEKKASRVSWSTGPTCWRDTSGPVGCRAHLLLGGGGVGRVGARGGEARGGQDGRRRDDPRLRADRNRDRPVFEEGGGYRILGRLHDQAPWIPFVTGWVSRDEAVKALRLAVQQDKRNFANRHFLAEALYRGDAREKTEAIALEEALVADGPSPQHLVEEIKTQEDARQNLAAWKKAA